MSDRHLRLAPEPSSAEVIDLAERMDNGDRVAQAMRHDGLGADPLEIPDADLLTARDRIDAAGRVLGITTAGSCAPSLNHEAADIALQKIAELRDSANHVLKLIEATGDRAAHIDFSTEVYGPLVKRLEMLEERWQS